MFAMNKFKKTYPDLNIGDYMRITTARNLPGKKVISTDGEEVGNLLDIEFDTKTGKLLYVIIDPNENFAYRNEKLKTDDGKIKIPFDAVMAAKDYVIVDKKFLVTTGQK